MAYIELIDRINTMFPDLRVTASLFDNQSYSFLKDFLLRAMLELKVDVDNITKIQLSQPASDSSNMITAINILCTIRRVFNIPMGDIGLFDILFPSSQITVDIITKMMDYLEFGDNIMGTAFDQSKKYIEATKEKSDLHNKLDKLNEKLNECSLKMSAMSDKKNKVTADLDELQKNLDLLNNEKQSLELKLHDLKANEKSGEKVKLSQQKLLLQITNDIDNLQKKVVDFSDEVVESLDTLKEEAKAKKERKDTIWNKVCEQKNSNTCYQNYIQLLKPLHSTASEVIQLAKEYESILNEKTVLKNKDYQLRIKEKETSITLLKEKLSSINKELLFQSENFKSEEAKFTLDIDSRNKDIELLMTSLRELSTHMQQSLNEESRLKEDTDKLKSNYTENLKSYQLKDDTLQAKLEMLKEEALLRKSKMEENLSIYLNLIRNKKEKVKKVLIKDKSRL